MPTSWCSKGFLGASSVYSVVTSCFLSLNLTANVTLIQFKVFFSSMINTSCVMKMHASSVTVILEKKVLLSVRMYTAKDCFNICDSLP